MGDFDGIKIGVCQCFYLPKAATEWIDLGLTQGGVMWKYSSKWHEIKVDQYGDTIVDGALIGEAVSAKIPMAESSFDKLTYAITAGNVITGTGANAGKTKMAIGSRPGLRLQDVAGTLKLHPISAGDSQSDDIVIYKAAVANSDVELPFKVDDERVLEVEYIGIVDRSRADGSLLCHVGETFENLATVSLSEPEEAATISGVVTLKAVATNAVKVEFYAGATLLYTDNLAPFEYLLDTTTLDDGAAVLTAKATNPDGVVTTSTAINVVVDNTP